MHHGPDRTTLPLRAPLRGPGDQAGSPYTQNSVHDEAFGGGAATAVQYIVWAARVPRDGPVSIILGTIVFRALGNQASPNHAGATEIW